MKNFTKLSLPLLLCIALALSGEVDPNYSFSDYLIQFDKHYPDPEEYGMRQSIFEQRLQDIMNFNQNTENTYHKEINRFTDWTEQEIKGTTSSI